MTETNWTDKLACFTPNYITHDVAGQEVHFYPVSVGMVFKLRTIGKPIARSLTVLFGRNDNDTSSKIIKTEDGEQVSNEAISEGLAKIRHDQRTEAIDGIIEALTDPENIKVVGAVIMDSLEEVFPKNERRDWPPPEVFMETLPLPSAGAMLVGLMHANKEVFGPLTDQVVAATTAAVDNFAAKAAAAREERETPEPVNTTTG